MAIEKVKVTLTNGQKYVLRKPEELSGIDLDRTAIFVFDNMEVYTGRTDGEVDDEGDFCIVCGRIGHGIGMPFRRLAGWAYKRK